MYTPSMSEISFEPVRCPEAPVAGSSSDLVNTYGSRLFTLARHITQNDSDAGNVLIESFLQVCSQRHGCEGEEDLWLALVTAAVREAFSALHKRVAGPCPAPSIDCSGNLVVRELSVWRDDWEFRHSKKQTAHILETGLGRLDPMARTVFVLRDIEQISIERIAGILSRPAAAVDVWLMRARLELREALASHMRLSQ